MSTAPAQSQQTTIPLDINNQTIQVSPLPIFLNNTPMPSMPPGQNHMYIPWNFKEEPNIPHASHYSFSSPSNPQQQPSYVLYKQESLQELLAIGLRREKLLQQQQQQSLYSMSQLYHAQQVRTFNHHHHHGEMLQHNNNHPTQQPHYQSPASTASSSLAIIHHHQNQNQNQSLSITSTPVQINQQSQSPSSTLSSSSSFMNMDSILDLDSLFFQSS